MPFYFRIITKSEFEQPSFLPPTASDENDVPFPSIFEGKDNESEVKEQQQPREALVDLARSVEEEGQKQEEGRQTSPEKKRRRK